MDNNPFLTSSTPVPPSQNPPQTIEEHMQQQAKADTMKAQPQPDRLPAPSEPITPLFQAVEAHFLAMRAKAVVNLNNYLNSSAGIGEHPDIVAEAIKLLETIDHAEGVLQTLKRGANEA